jgi:hypothetical protein
MEILSSPLGKLVLSLALLAAIAPIVVRFFRGTWADLEAEAAAARKSRGESRPPGRPRACHLRPWRALAVAHQLLRLARLLRWQSVQPFLQNYADSHPGTLDVGTYRDLYWRVYWGLSRYGAYLLPLAVWPFVFKESPLDLGTALSRLSRTRLDLPALPGHRDTDVGRWFRARLNSTTTTPCTPARPDRGSTSGSGKSSTSASSSAWRSSSAASGCVARARWAWAPSSPWSCPT